MPVAMIVDNPHGSQEIYERVTALLELEFPLGGILHLAGPSPNGGWCVVEVWETQEEALRFLKERFAPALEAIGVSGPPPKPQFMPVHTCVTAPVTVGR